MVTPGEWEGGPGHAVTHRRTDPGTLSPVAAPVAQGIEHRPPEAGAQVRILPGAHLRHLRTCRNRPVTSGDAVRGLFRYVRLCPVTR